jgi:hypothetical protein
MAKEKIVNADSDSVILICKEKCARGPKLGLKFEGGKMIVKKSRLSKLQNDPEFKKVFGKLIGVFGDSGFTAKDTSVKVISLGDSDVPPDVPQEEVSQ